MAKAKGSEKLVYCCAGYTHTAKAVLPESQDEHAYILDVLLDKLVGHPLRIAPMTVAYFEGCHASYRGPFPEVSLDWGRYRRFLGTVEGLRVVDVPNTICCKQKADAIISRAEDAGAAAHVCACSGCHVALRAAGQGRLRVVSYPELLVRCLGEDDAKASV